MMRSEALDIGREMLTIAALQFGGVSYDGSAKSWRVLAVVRQNGEQHYLYRIDRWEELKRAVGGARHEQA